MADELDHILAASGLEVYNRDGMLLPRMTEKGKAALSAYILAEALKVVGEDGKPFERISDAGYEEMLRYNERNAELRQALTVRFGGKS